MAKGQDNNVHQSLLKYNVNRWQSILLRLKKKPSLAAVRSSNKQFECNRCKNKFVLLSGLERHKSKFHADDAGAAPPEKVWYFASVIQCVYCQAVFANVDQYVDHIIRHHSESLTSSYLSGGEDQTSAILYSPGCIFATGAAFMCEFCDTRFSDLPSLFHHESLHDPADGFRCNFCQLNVPTIEGMLAHRVGKPEAITKVHDGAIPNVPNEYCCNICKGCYRSLQELYNHRYEMKHFFPRKTQKEQQMRGLIEHCAICGYLSNSAAELELHLNENHGKSTNATNNTANGSRRTSVINQEASSKLSRPYLCEQCGKTYTQSSHLFQHLRFHNGVRPFACPNKPCERSFTIGPDLKDHIRKCHTGERPFKCEECGKRFLTGSVYYQHRLIHRGERRYACPDCDRRFYRTDALKNHQRIHTGEKPFACHVCDRKFRQRGDREKHVRVKHMKIR
uniref:C2H2-type domain-containing protein n=1 Tax=Anopheles atroparvus TaxID=41427 RepID=A0AAG5DU84_ANOAO